MSSLSAIFFDLDGTLVDSSIGIHNGFTYTFEQLGVPSPDAKTIRSFMGPPLETSFSSCLPANQIELAIQLYRSYYKEKGMYEAQLFPQIKDLLTELAQQYPVYTRIIEHKHFEYGTQPKTVITREYPADWKRGDEPYYPINDEKNNAMFAKYQEEAAKNDKVIFCGRLADYKYYDMHVVIERALEVVEKEFSK